MGEGKSEREKNVCNPGPRVLCDLYGIAVVCGYFNS
jgi:hypothetical protein